MESQLAAARLRVLESNERQRAVTADLSDPANELGVTRERVAEATRHEVEPQPVAGQVDESGEQPAPDPTRGGVTEAVRQYGSQLDGVQGLEYVTPVPESVVQWLREQVRAAVGTRGTQASFGADLDRRLTAEYLLAEWPRVRSESGLPLSIPADGGQTTWLRVVLRDVVAADPGIEQLPDGPPVAFQRWAFGGWEVAETGSAGDLRSMRLPFAYSHKWPVDNGSELRRVVLTVQPTVTYNQTSTSVTVAGGVQVLTLLRSRERSWPYSYEMRWQMRVGGDVNRPWTDLIASPAERLTVWFPKHLVEDPRADAEQPQPAPLDTLRNDVPLFGVQSVPNADRIFSDVMASFRPHLAALSKASRRDLREFFGEYSLRANIPLMWAGSHPSPLLFEENGSVIGYLRVRTRLVAREVTGPATQDAVLESHVLRTLRIEGSAKVTNAVGVDGFLSFGMSKAPADADTGVEPTGGSVRGQAGVRHQVSHALGSGGGARTSHSLRTRKPLIPQAVDVSFEVELVRAADAAARPGPVTPLGSGVSHRAILRVPAADLVTQRPTAPRYLPPEIAQLRSLGVSTTPLRVTGTESLFASAETWLVERGFLPPDNDPMLEKLTDEATRVQRLENVRKLDVARSGTGLRGAVDEMVEGGYSIVFELPVRGEVQRVEVRVSAERRFTDEPEGGVVHNLVLPDIQTLNWTGSTLPASEGRTRSPFGWNVGFAGSYSNPLDLADYGRPLQSVSGGVNRFSRPAKITETNIGFGQELYALSPSGEGSHAFEVPVRLRMEISWSHGGAPGPNSVDGTFALAVPTYRTLAQPVEIRPYQIPVPREVTDQDRASLNRPDGDVIYRDGVLRLPELAYVDRVEGSRSIRAVVRDLVGTVRRAATAAEQSAASGPDMPGAFPVDDAALPSPVEGDMEMQSPRHARMLHGQAEDDRTFAMPGAFPSGEANAPVEVRGDEPAAGDQTVGLWGARAARWFGGMVVGGWAWAKRRAIGEPLTRPESMGQEVVHAAVSPHHLAANALQVFNNQYVSENIGEHGMVWGTDVSVTVEGYLTDVETLPPPGTMDMECWLQSLDGSSHTAESSVSYEVPATVTGTYGSDTQFVPSGTYTHGRRRDARTTFSDNTMAFRVTTENDVSTFRFRAKAIYVITVTKGGRNVVAGTLWGRPCFEEQIAVELPEAVEFLLVENDLFNHPELRQVPGVPPADPQKAVGTADRRLPPWFVRSRGELGFGVATAVAPLGSRPQFREGIRALVETQAPGVTRPGHAAYLPGVRSRIADHSSPLGLRTLINAGPEGRASFHFVHRSWLGPRLVEVEFSAQPSQNAAQLAERRGRKTSTSAGLDTILAHSSGEGGSLQIPGASKQSVTRVIANNVAFSPLVKRNDHQGQPSLAMATQHSRTNAASSLRESRTWQRTVATTQFDRVPYTLGVTVRSMPLSDALIVGVGRAAINGLVAVGWLVRPAWRSLPRVSAVSESSQTFPALATLRFSEAETPHDPIAEQRRVQPVMLSSAPTPVVPPPTGAVVIDMEVPPEVRALATGTSWLPSRAFSVYDFDAVAQLAEAIRTVDPSLARDDRLHNSTSAEGIFVRLAHLARSGKVTMMEPAAVGRLLGRTGTPGTSLQFALYSPKPASSSRNVAIDSINANTDSFTTTVNASVTPTSTVGGTHPFTHDVNNYGGPAVPIVGVEAAQGQSAGGSAQRREILRFGTSMESADGHGTPGYQVTAVAVIRVEGPNGTRWVVGNLEMRTTEAPPVEVAAEAIALGAPDTDAPALDVLASSSSSLRAPSAQSTLTTTAPLIFDLERTALTAHDDAAPPRTMATTQQAPADAPSATFEVGTGDPANAVSDPVDDDPVLPDEVRSMDGVWFAGALPGSRDELALTRLTQAVLAAGAQRHVVIVNTPRLQPQNASIVAAVRQAADRLAWWDGRGVIVVVLDADPTLQAWLEHAPVVTTRRVPAPADKDQTVLDTVWELRAAGGRRELFQERPTADMFTAAVEMSRASARPPLPRDLARWVCTNTWTQRQDIFDEFRDRLVRPELLDALERLASVNAQAGPESVMTWLDHVGLRQVAERIGHDSQRVRRGLEGADSSSMRRGIANRVLGEIWAESRAARELAAMSVILRRELATHHDKAHATTPGSVSAPVAVGPFSQHPPVAALSTQQMFAYLSRSAPEWKDPHAGRFMLRAVFDRQLSHEDYASLVMAGGTTTSQRMEGIFSAAVAVVLELTRRVPDQHRDRQLLRGLDDLITSVRCLIDGTLRFEWVSRINPAWWNDTPLANSMHSHDQLPSAIARLNHLAELIVTCGY
ncbi:hypothetical protein [Dactylosporangium sp. CA-233914]|uniref:hypothetical protein n=1 Tax=Dactylosporangium sp. CA-233914 TaxID=3239934 RepID=UPI003D90DCD5